MTVGQEAEKVPGLAEGKLRISGIILLPWGPGRVQEDKLLLFNPSLGMSSSISELACSVSLSGKLLRKQKWYFFPCKLLVSYRAQGEARALLQLLLSWSCRKVLGCSAEVMLTLLWLGVAGVMEMTVLRKAGEGEGEGVLASSWMTGMILLVVRPVL